MGIHFFDESLMNINLVNQVINIHSGQAVHHAVHDNILTDLSLNCEAYLQMT